MTWKEVERQSAELDVAPSVREHIEQLQAFAPPPPRPALGTARHRVLRMLEIYRGEWVAGWQLCDPEVGGSEGLRRVRELRADGWPIEMKRGPRATRFYRLP